MMCWNPKDSNATNVSEYVVANKNNNGGCPPFGRRSLALTSAIIFIVKIKEFYSKTKLHSLQTWDSCSSEYSVVTPQSTLVPHCGHLGSKWSNESKKLIFSPPYLTFGYMDI